MKAVNLIPADKRAVTTTTGMASSQGPRGDAYGAYAVLGVLAVAVVAAALYVLAGNGIRDKQAELARVEQEATTVEQQSSSLQAFADFKTLADTRAQTVRGLAEARFPWPRTLDDISRALPADTFINSLDGSTAASTTGSGLRTAIAAPSIELTGCTRTQSSVARMMSTLRGVRGVTRVTLVKSQKTPTSGTATAPAPATPTDGSTSAITSQPCPKGEPPAFDVIIFFERAAATAATAVNSAIGATGPSGPAGATTGPTGATSTTPASATTTAP